jgi:hypothetical protein
MLGYIGLTILLVVVFPTLCYFTGFIQLYVEYSAYIAAAVILFWVFIDLLRMRTRKASKKRSRAHHH